MKIDEDIDLKVLEDVYTPSEDSFLLLDLIELEGSEEVLELGCGSGIISLHCTDKGCDVLAVDKSEKALENTKRNAVRNDFNLRVMKSDLFSEIDKKSWDVIIFNPPYLPRDSDMEKDDRWDGGEKGDEVIFRFLKNAKTYLKDDGKIYLCYSSLSPEDKINEAVEKDYEIIDKSKREFFFETLYGLCLRKKK